VLAVKTISARRIVLLLDLRAQLPPF